MPKEEDFLIEEYKTSVKTALWLEESLGRNFRNFAMVFIWNMILAGLLVKGKIHEQSIFEILENHPARILFAVSSVLVFLYSILTIVNMAKTRYGDVLQVSRMNFIRNWFLEKMCETSKRQYFEDFRLRNLNCRDIYARPAWSWTSDLTLYLILTSFLGSVELMLAYGCFFEMRAMPIVLVLLALNIIIVLFTKIYLMHKLG